MYGIAMFCCFFPLLTCLHHVLSWSLLRQVTSLDLWHHDSVTPTACPSGCRTTTSSGTELVAKVQALGGCHHQIRWGAALHFATTGHEGPGWLVLLMSSKLEGVDEWCRHLTFAKKYPSYLILGWRNQGHGPWYFEAKREVHHGLICHWGSLEPLAGWLDAHQRIDWYGTPSFGHSGFDLPKGLGCLDGWMDAGSRSHFGRLSFGTWGLQDNRSSQRFARCCYWEFEWIWCGVCLARDGTRLAYCEKHQYIDGMKHHVATVKAVASTVLQLLSSPRMPQVRHLP